MNIRKLTLLTAALLISANAIADQSHDKEHKHNDRFALALVGDGPYGVDQEIKWDKLIADINADDSVKFTIHIGDIKAGGERCDDSLLISRFNQLQQLDGPLVYTPGDNEWTDCHRTNNGSYLPTERLAFIRNIFFPYPGRTTGGKAMRVETEASLPGFEQFVENTLFKKGDVVFATIHVVGSNNNLKPWNQLPEGDHPAERMAEYNNREQANLAWLKRVFEVANNSRARGIMISMQADPNFDIDPEDTNNRSGFNAILDTLAEKTLAYGRPVLLAHGDSHIYRADKPRLVPYYQVDGGTSPEADIVKVPNLTRVESFGDHDNHWVKIIVDSSSKEVFSIVPQVVESNL